jgi:uncharacterized membrane protein YgaE (UPF0421/DUF939 family)
MNLPEGVLVASALAITIALVEVAKLLGLKSKYAPIVAILIGIGTSFLGSLQIGIDLIIPGIVIGLTACGLYSGTKATLSK